MAKKIKQKKSGMLRRRQQKRQKKKIQRRATMPSRRIQQQNSQENIEQLLSTLPTLAFEQELADLRMNESELKRLLENKHTETNIFLELITDEFVHDLDKRLATIEDLNPEKSIKSVLAKATRHQISNNEKRKVYFTPSGEISSFQFDCIISKEHWTFYMNNSGKVRVNGKK